MGCTPKAPHRRGARRGRGSFNERLPHPRSIGTGRGAPVRFDADLTEGLRGRGGEPHHLEADPLDGMVAPCEEDEVRTGDGAGARPNTRAGVEHRVELVLQGEEQGLHVLRSSAGVNQAVNEDHIGSVGRVVHSVNVLHPETPLPEGSGAARSTSRGD